MSAKNTAELRQMLLETIEGVKNGSIDPKKAQAIAGLSSKIIQSARLDLEVLKVYEGREKQPDPVMLTNEKDAPK